MSTTDSSVKQVEKVKIQTVKCLKKKEPVMKKVGVTTVELTFEDQRKFVTKVYGRVDQYHNAEVGPYLGYYKINKWTDAYVENIHVKPSLELAKEYIEYTCYGKVKNSEYPASNLSIEVVDDPRNPTQSIRGKVISAKLLETDENVEVEFTEVYLVEEIKVLT